MPDDYPPDARHDQGHAYFEDYVEHFELRRTITFDTAVTVVTRAVVAASHGAV